jgi:hypothetical protein
MPASYENVPEFASTIGNTFSVTLTAAGGIEFGYGATAGNDALVAVTPGGGAPIRAKPICRQPAHCRPPEPRTSSSSPASSISTSSR